MATASTKTAIQPTGGRLRVEDIPALLTAGTDEVFKRGFDPGAFPFEGSMFFMEEPITKSTRTSQTTVGMGNTPLNRDGERLPYDSQQQGFANTQTPNTYRKAASWEREVIEDELYGLVRDNATELMMSARRTVELIMADGVNRAIGDIGSSAPFLAEDGLYWIDATRNNPSILAGQWSNVEATAALTPSSVFTASLNFTQNNDARGHRQVLQLEEVICRPDEQMTLHEILQSDLRPYDSQNASNFVKGRYQGRIYNLMTTAQVMYKAAGAKNEVMQIWRVRPGTEPVETGDPDLFAIRSRFRFTIGCDRPTVWRGGQLS